MVELPMQLPDRLLLREVSPRDKERLGELLAAVHASPEGIPNASVGRWQRDLFDRGHPTLTPEQMLVVEDSSKGVLVSAFTMIPQTWSYAGVPIGVSLLELAATHPDYRGKNLLRKQLDVLTARSEARGDLLQGMTDVLFFQPGDIGYQMAITQRAGRGGTTRNLPLAEPGEEPVKLRPARLEDIPMLATIDAHARQRSLLSCVRDESQWRHELRGRSPDSMVHSPILIIEEPSGSVGFLVMGYGGIPSFPIPTWRPGLPCPEAVVSISRYELLPGTSWFAVTSSVLRQLTGARGHEEGYMLWLGEEHPAYDVLGDALTRRPPSMGWFLRVPRWVPLLQRLKPVLEQRLVGTAGQAFTGELCLHFYRQGVRIRFVDGKVSTIEPWPEFSRRTADVSLPDTLLMQLLFGHGTWRELAPAYPDSRLQTDRAALLLPLLFPKLSSNIWPLI